MKLTITYKQIVIFSIIIMGLVFAYYNYQKDSSSVVIEEPKPGQVEIVVKTVAPEVKAVSVKPEDSTRFIVEPVMNEKLLPEGLTLTFVQEQSVQLGKTLDHSMLPGISLQPNWPFTGQWNSMHQFEIKWQRPESDYSDVAVMVKQLPSLDKTKSLNIDPKYTGPHVVQTPTWQVNAFVVHELKPKRYVKLKMIWNHDMSADAVKEEITFSILRANKQVWEDLHADHIEVVADKNHTQLVTIHDLALKGGEKLKFSFGEQSTVLGRKVVLNTQDSLSLAEPPQIEILHPSASEGSDFFTLTIPFHVRGANLSYHDQRQARLDAAIAKPFISISPAIDFEVVAGRGNFRLVGAFKAQTKYELTFFPGLKGTKNEWLTHKVVKIVSTPGFKPKLNFLSKARYLPKLDGAQLSFEYRNVDAINVIVKRVPPQNLIFWMTQNRNTFSGEVSEEVFKTQLALEMETDKKARGMIDLSEMTVAGKGVYQVMLYQRHKNGTVIFKDSAMIVVTDLAAVAKQDGSNLHVWTRAAKDFSAKGGVKIKVMSFNNFEIASCITQSDGGGCLLEGVMKQNKKPYALVMSTDDDLSYMRFSDVVLSNGDNQESMRAYSNNSTALEAYVYSSRGVYRPGEVVNLASVVWSGDRKAASKIPLHWKIFSSRQKVVKEINVESTEFGMSSLDFKLDDYAGTGKYQAILSSGKKQLSTYGFFVEEFVPERIGLNVSPYKTLVKGSEDIHFNLDAKYLFGPPVAEGNYKARFSLKPAWFTIPGQKKFSTGEYRLTKQAAMILQPAEGRLDQNGLANISVSVNNMQKSFPTVMKLTSHVDVTESGSGRVTNRSASTLVSAYDEIIGVRELKAKDGEIEVEGKFFTPEGAETRKNGKVQVSVLQIYSNWTYAWNPEMGHDSWQREDILMSEGDSFTIDVNDGRFEAQLHTNNSWGRYVVRVQSTESKQTSDLLVSMGYSWYWSGQASSALKPRAPDQITLYPSVKEANAGEEVSFSFESPFAGQALFAIEADTVLESRWFEVKKGPNTIDIEAPDFLPNVYASLLVIKDPREGEMYVPARAWGSVSLKIIPQDFLINVITELPQEMRPGNDLVIKLNNDNHQKTEYSVAVVDEGILQLTRFQTPKPLNYFFEPRRQGVSTFETVGWTFPRTISSDQGQVGGGADAASKKSGRVMPVRLVSHWSGIISSNNQGDAEIRVPIPSFQGKVRVMVVAAQSGKVGHSEQHVTVRDPLVMQPTLPRFLQWGDNFEIPVFVVNMTGKEQKVTATVSVSNEVQLSQDTQVVNIPDMGSATVFFPAQVNAFDGKADFKFKVQTGDVETHDNMSLPILPLSAEQTVNLTLPTDKPFRIVDYLPEGLHQSGLKVHMTVSTIPYISELTRLRYLIRYPYGCIEQTTSSTMPLLYVGQLLGVLDPKALEGKNIDDMVYSGLNRLLSMQTISGGFAYWPGGSKPVLWGTAYATHLLLKAKEQGYDVSEHALNDALDFMQEALSSRQYQWRDHHYYYGDSEPYMAYVLGLAGRHQKSIIRKLASGGSWQGGRALENRFLVMLAAQMAGDKALAEGMLKDYHLFSVVDAQGRDYSGSYWSSFRTDAMRLSLAQDVWPDDTRLDALMHRVANRLATTPYLNTQEAAWSVSGLGKVANHFQGATTKGVELNIDGKKVPSEFHDKQVMGWSFYGEQLPSDKTIQLQYQGDKAPFLHATITGYRSSLATPAATTTHLVIKRSYLSLQGEAIDPMQIKQGQLLVVRLDFQNNSGQKIENIAISDRLPAGFEVENANLGRSDDMPWVDESSLFKPAYVDRKDDRVNIFGDLADSRVNEWLHYYYIVRAVSQGEFTAAAAKVEAMYEPEKHAYSGYSKVKIQSP